MTRGILSLWRFLRKSGPHRYTTGRHTRYTRYTRDTRYARYARYSIGALQAGRCLEAGSYLIAAIAPAPADGHQNIARCPRPRPRCHVQGPVQGPVPLRATHTAYTPAQISLQRSLNRALGIHQARAEECMHIVQGRPPVPRRSLGRTLGRPGGQALGIDFTLTKRLASAVRLVHAFGRTKRVRACRTSKDEEGEGIVMVWSGLPTCAPHPIPPIPLTKISLTRDHQGSIGPRSTTRQGRCTLVAGKRRRTTHTYLVAWGETAPSHFPSRSHHCDCDSLAQDG